MLVAIIALQSLTGTTDVTQVYEIKIHNEAEHMKNRTDLKFIKDNMFNPHTGLWAETKQNTQFRQSTSKWRGIIGTGFVGLFVKHVWDMFQP